MTDSRYKALGIMMGGPISAGDFAARMWPDSDGWRRCHNVGRGAARGVGMYKAGGSYLGRLRKDGLVRHVESIPLSMWVITEMGREAYIQERLQRSNKAA